MGIRWKIFRGINIAETGLIFLFSFWRFYTNSVANQPVIFISLIIKSIPILIIANCINNLLLLNFLQASGELSFKRKFLSYILWFYMFVIVLLLVFVFLDYFKKGEFQAMEWDTKNTISFAHNIFFPFLGIYILIEQFNLIKLIKLNSKQRNVLAIEKIGGA